jgi:pimeloyl-ACP methyl ester carboxylesterase
MPYVEVDDGRLFYARTLGRTPGVPTLVLIHGAGGSHLQWPSELRQMSDGTVLALDLPGHGRSDGPGCRTIEDYVITLIAFLDATGRDRATLGRDSAVLMGHSMGGAISQLAALTHPDRVAGLILVGTGARLRVAPLMLDRILDDPDSAYDMITQYAWAGSAPEELTRLGRQTLAETPPQITHGDLLACDTFDVMERVSAIKAPTLVISGTADLLTPHKYGAYLAEHIPNAQLLTVKGGGHMMVLEQPNVIAGAVSAFVKGL